MRHRSDANQEQIFAALRKIGALVKPTSQVGDGFPDAVIAHRVTKTLGLLEIKDGSKPPSQRTKTGAQIKFWDEWKGVPMAQVNDIEGALRFYAMLGTTVASR